MAPLTFEVRPHEGVAPVMLGMNRSEAQAALVGIGCPPTSGGTAERDVFLDSAFHVHYSDASKVEYIELSRTQAFVVSLDGTALLDMPADEAVKAVAARSPFDPDDPELGWSYTFPALDLALWRPTRDDTTFSTVGVGVPGYFTRPTSP